MIKILNKNIKKRKIKAILFDFDDTLEDWSISDKPVYNKLSEKLSKDTGIKSRTEIIKLWKKARDHFENDHPKFKFDRMLWIRRFCEENNIKMTKSQREEIVDLYWQTRTKHVKLFPKVRSTLNNLRKKYKIGMLTDSDGRLKYKYWRIDKYNLRRYFDVIVTGDSLHRDKPSKSLFNYTAKKLGIKPEECMMVGDSPERDLVGGKNDKMVTVWIRQGQNAKRYKNPPKYVDIVINKIHEIKDVPKKLEQ